MAHLDTWDSASPPVLLTPRGGETGLSPRLPAPVTLWGGIHGASSQRFERGAAAPTQRAQGSLALCEPRHSSGGSDAVHGQCQGSLGHRSCQGMLPVSRGRAGRALGSCRGWELPILPPAAQEPWLPHGGQGDAEGAGCRGRSRGRRFHTAVAGPCARCHFRSRRVARSPIRSLRGGKRDRNWGSAFLPWQGHNKDMGTAPARG